MRTLLLSFPLLLLLLPSCSRPEAPSGHDHGKAGHHHHEAPHGGTLVEVGDHQYNVELVWERDLGVLSVYFLDAHAENFLRLPLPSVTLELEEGAAATPGVLLPVANTATGETVGNTSHFRLEGAFLREGTTLRGRLLPFAVRGQTFGPLPFTASPVGAR